MDNEIKSGKFFSIEEENKEIIVEEKTVEENNTFNQVFGERIDNKVETTQIEEVKPVVEKNKVGVEIFNIEPAYEEKELIIEEEKDDFVEEVGNNPMIDYERINAEAKLKEEELKSEEEIIEEQNMQLNNARKVNTQMSDFMMMKMQRR